MRLLPPKGLDLSAQAAFTTKWHVKCRPLMALLSDLNDNVICMVTIEHGEGSYDPRSKSSIIPASKGDMPRILFDSGNHHLPHNLLSLPQNMRVFV
jgi:hypothetical protein